MGRDWTPADRELVAQAIRDNNPPKAWVETYPLIPADHWAAAVLDALADAGRLRANAAAAIRSEVDGLRNYPADYVAGMRRAADIAEGDHDA